MLRPKKGMFTDDTVYAGGTPNFDERTGQSTGSVKGGPTKQAPIVRPTEIERAPPKPLPETKETAPAPEPEAEMTFTFVEGKERGNAAQNYLYGQEGEVQQLTVSELRDYFESDKVNRLPEVFGTFDNYLAYMTEREQLIQSGDYDTGSWAEADTGFTQDQEMLLAGEDLTIDPSDPMQDPAQLERMQTQTQAAAYNNWINSDANQALLQKYGVNPVVYSNSGDKFAWNGSAYVKVVDEDHAGVGDFVKIGLAIAAGVATGGAASSALSSALGATGSAAVGAGLGSAVSQGIATGEIDIEKALIAAATAGITNEFSEFLGTYVEGSTQEQIKRLRDIQATVQPGGNAYQAAQQQIDLLTGALESADLVNQSGSIVNLVGDATEAYNQYRDIQENIDNFTEENEDAAWQTPDTTDILGDVQVQIRDYVSELEEQREQSGESGAQPAEDIFADTTAEETGLEPETTITEEMFSEYFPEPVEGPQGDPGRDGVDGIDGVDGVDGRDGIDGVDGQRGEQGEQGDPGRDGIDGRDGVDGRDADPEVVRGIVESVVNNAISNIPPGTSTEEVREIVNAAIIGLDIPEGMTADQVREIVGTAIGNIQFPDSVTQEQVNQVVSGVRSDLETATTELGASIADVRGEVRDVESSLRDALEAQSEGQTRELTEAEARLLSEITGVEAGLLQQLSTVQGGLNSRLQNLGTDLDSVRDELGTSILGVQREVSEVERSLTEALEAATLGQATDLSDAEARLLSELTGVEEDILQQMAESDAGLEAGLFDLGTNINQVRADLQSQMQTTQEETTRGFEQASDERRQLQEALAAQAQGQARQLTEAEARLLSQITGVEANTLRQLSTVEGALNNQLNQLGTNINSVQNQLEQSIAGIAAGQQTAEQERRDLQQALIAVGGDVNRLDAQTRQQFEAFGEDVNQLFAGVNVDIEGLQAGQVSQAEAFAQYQADAATQATQATEERRNLQQAIIGAQGDIEQLDANTRQQLEEFGGTVNELFSDVNVDIEALQAGQISQAEAQQAFQQSTEEQFGEIGGQIGDLGTQIGGIQSDISGIGRGLEGLGEGVAGLGQGLGAGLMGLAAQQAMLPGQIAAATPIDPVEFEKFQRGLTRRKLADPLRIGMFTGGARSV